MAYNTLGLYALQQSGRRTIWGLDTVDNVAGFTAEDRKQILADAAERTDDIDVAQLRRDPLHGPGIDQQARRRDHQRRARADLHRTDESRSGGHLQHDHGITTVTDRQLRGVSGAVAQALEDGTCQLGELHRCQVFEADAQDRRAVHQVVEGLAELGVAEGAARRVDAEDLDQRAGALEHLVAGVAQPADPEGA